MAIPVMRVWCGALAVLLLVGHSEARNITNEDIRDAMLSLVHMFRTSEDKLERHEYREKALGEQLKKMMVGLEKKHRALEPLKGMISRLDERLYNVENIFLQKEEKEKVSQKKTNEVLADIQKSLQTLTDIVTKLPTNIVKRLDDTDAKLAALHTEVADVKSRLDKDSLRAVCLQESENPLERHISEAEKLLNKYELKLNEYGNASRVQTDFVPLSDVSLADEAWHSKMTEVMESQEKDIKKIQQLLGDAESMWKDLPRLSDLNKYTNQTLEGVAALQRNLTEADEKSVAKVTAKLRDMGDRLLATNEDIQASLTQGNTMSERAYNDIQRSYDALRLEVQTFSKNLMQSIADETNATKKRIEYGNHNLLMEISGITRVQGDLLNMTINERFDNTEAVIMASQAGSFKILSGKIESDMSQVWRQIGTMYQQLAATKTTLDKLTEQTAQYVNGSATALDGIKTKIGQVSSLTAEVQENVNYFMGKVSLLSQEFSHVKESLGAALDEATTNLRDAKTEIGKDNGPGPHVAKPAA